MLKLKVLFPMIVLTGFFAFAASGQAAQSRFIADTETSSALGADGITPDIVAPAELVLSPKGNAVALFPTVRRHGVTTLKGGLSVQRGSTRVVMRTLRLRGNYLVGRLGSSDQRILYLNGFRGSAKTGTFDAASLTGTAARILRQRFTSNVFHRGLRIFESGRIR